MNGSMRTPTHSTSSGTMALGSTPFSVAGPIDAWARRWLKPNWRRAWLFLRSVCLSSAWLECPQLSSDTRQYAGSDRCIAPSDNGLNTLERYDELAANDRPSTLLTINPAVAALTNAALWTLCFRNIAATVRRFAME